MALAGLVLAGGPWAIVQGAVSSPGVAPGQVGSLTPGTPTSNAIPVTYTAPTTGDAPISLAGYTSPHGANVWTVNAGTFGATGGTFISLSAATNYDVRIVATNTAGASTTDYLAGITTGSVGSGGLVLYVSEDYYQADAQYTVALDGAAVGGTRTATVLRSSGNAEAVAISGALAAGWHTLTITFLNDQYGGTPTTDRNLWVNSAAYNSAPIRFSCSKIGSTGQKFVIAFAVGMDGALTAETTEGYVEPAPAMTSVGNRVDIQLAQSVVASGSAASGTLTPNGAFDGTTYTLVAIQGTGTFSPATLTPAAGSSVPVAFTYTPSATGEHLIGCTNNGAIYNPYGAPLNVFSAASGSARTIAASLASGMDYQPYQFDTLTGASGFTFGAAKGYGEVPLNLSSLSGASAGLFAKLFDPDSAGATTTAGTGTAFHSTPVQVYGPVSAAGVKRLLLPAGFYYMDLATDAAFTNPVRVPQRFCVGLGMALLGRSQRAGIVQWYPDASAPGESYTKTFVLYSNDNRYGANGSWLRHDGTPTTDDPENGVSRPSAGAMAAGRVIAAALGVPLFMLGVQAGIGGGIDQYIGTDGSLSAAFQTTITQGAINEKFRLAWLGSLAGWDGSEGQSYYETQKRVTLAVTWLANRYKSVASIGICLGCTGRPEADGSGSLGPTRLQQTVLNRIARTNRMVVSNDDHLWAEFYSGHGSQSSRRLYAPMGMRQLLTRDMLSGGAGGNLGPALGAGTIASGSRVARVPVKLNGGTALQTLIITQNDPAYTLSVGTATASNLASLVSLYLRGGYAGKSKPIAISGVAINTSALPSGADATLDVTLAGASGITYSDGSTGAFPAGGFSLCYAADLGASGGDGWTVIDTTASSRPTSKATLITDNQVSGPWEWGYHLQPAVDLPVSVV